MTTVSGRAGRWRKKYKGKTYYRYGDREHADQAVDKLSELRRRFAASKLSPLNREDWFEANFDLPMDAEWIRELPKLVGLASAANSTDAQLADKTFTALRDDKKTFQPYNACFVVREELLAHRPDIAWALGLLHNKVSEDAMRMMNRRVVTAHEPVAKVIKDFLETLDIAR